MGDRIVRRVCGRRCRTECGIPLSGMAPAEMGSRPRTRHQGADLRLNASAPGAYAEPGIAGILTAAMELAEGIAFRDYLVATLPTDLDELTAVCGQRCLQPTVSALTLPPSYWSPPVTTRTGCARRARLRRCAALLQSWIPPEGPRGTDFRVVLIVERTMRCIE